MSNDMVETYAAMNWDTNELDDWLMNDEGLYNTCLELYDRDNGNVTGEEAEHELAAMVAHLDIDLAEIDWDLIAESINNIHS